MEILPKITDGIDRREVLCTTYQMRNCFKQFADGVARETDFHCYFQHAAAADLCGKDARVLDVCCGRGMMLPFLRYRPKSTCSLYLGVDIHASNAVFKDGTDPRNGKQKDDWSFPVKFVESNVAEMTDPIQAVEKDPFDLIIYTSAIEHMQPDAQRASLKCCRELAHSGTILYLTCPVTESGNSGYDCHYAAHIYEPTRDELAEWLGAAGWKITNTIGLCTGCKTFRSKLTGSQLEHAEYLYKIMPREQALPTIAALYPWVAEEIAMVCSVKK